MGAKRTCKKTGTTNYKPRTHGTQLQGTDFNELGCALCATQELVHLAWDQLRAGGDLNHETTSITRFHLCCTAIRCQDRCNQPNSLHATLRLGKSVRNTFAKDRSSASRPSPENMSSSLHNHRQRMQYSVVSVPDAIYHSSWTCSPVAQC